VSCSSNDRFKPSINSPLKLKWVISEEDGAKLVTELSIKFPFLSSLKVLSVPVLLSVIVIVPGVNPSPTTLYGTETKFTLDPRNLSSASLLPPKLSYGFCEP